MTNVDGGKDQTRCGAMRGTLVVVASAAVLLAGAWGAWAQEEEVLARGRLQYQRYCAGCHGPGGKGDGDMAEWLEVKPTDLTSLARENRGQFPFWRTYRIIDGREDVRLHGRRDMPIWGDWFRAGEDPQRPGGWVDLARGRIWQLVYYLESIQKK